MPGPKREPDAGSDKPAGDTPSSEYKAAAARWKRRAQRDYVFVLQTDNPSGSRRVRNTVVDGAVDKALSYFEAMPEGATIDDQLDAVAQAIAEHPQSLEVVYDETWGYPSELKIDLTSDLGDEHATSITCFVPGSDNGFCPL